MANKKKKVKKLTPLTIGLIVGVVVLLIGGLIALIVINSPNNEPKSVTWSTEDAEAMRLDAIAQQIRTKAENYHAQHGEWPSSIEDIHETKDRLPNMVFNSFRNMGFLLSYTGVNGDRIIYCSEDLAQTELGKNNCP